MMRGMLTAGAVALGLSGCGPMLFGADRFNPDEARGVTRQQAYADCDLEAEKAAPMNDRRRGALEQGMIQRGIINKCMVAKGFRQN